MSQSIEKSHRHWFYIYGFNLSILSGLIAGLAGRQLGPRRGALAAGVVIGAYILGVGGLHPAEDGSERVD